MRWRRRRKKKIASVIRTTPAATPVATPAMVPLACCLSGVMVGCEFSAAVVEVELVLELVDVVLGGGIEVVEGRVDNVVGVWVVGRSVGREDG